MIILLYTVRLVTQEENYCKALCRIHLISNQHTEEFSEGAYLQEYYVFINNDGLKQCACMIEDNTSDYYLQCHTTFDENYKTYEELCGIGMK